MTDDFLELLYEVWSMRLHVPEKSLTKTTNGTMDLARFRALSKSVRY